MDTLYLNENWDLELDISGNIALASAPYALAQDAASACRTFLAECWYDQTIGIPYWEQILGHWPSLMIVKSQLVSAAMTVPGVVSAQAFITGVIDRKLTGQIQVTDSAGNTSAAAF